MWCDYYERTVTEDDCWECNRNCANKRNLEKDKRRAEEIERLKCSELAIQIKQTLAKSLNLEEERIDNLIINLLNGVFKNAENQLTDCLETRAKQMAIEYVETKAKEELDAVFEKAIEEKVLVLARDEKAQETKIREIILERTKKFFASKERGDNRHGIQRSMGLAIERVVDSKVGEALTEIKEEAIEKFNKDIMKKMMLGMVGAIQGDKRLLAVLENSKE